MNFFDRLLDFLFHKIWGLLLLGIVTIGGAMFLTGCLPLNLLSCLLDGPCVGCGGCDEDGYGCFEHASVCVDTCIINSCDGCYSNEIDDNGDAGNVFTCIFGKGCVKTCGNTQCFSPGCGGCKHTEYFYCEGNMSKGPGTITNNDPWDDPSNVKSCVFFACAKVPKKIAVVTLKYSDDTTYTRETIYDTTDQADLQLYHPSKTGFTFHGYFTKPNGEGKQYTDTDGNLLSGIKIKKDITLYAYITEIGIGKTYSISFNSSTDLDFTTATAIGGSSAPDLPKAPEKEGYTFKGWFTEPNGRGAWVADNNGWFEGYETYHAYNFDMNETVTLYAYYSPKIYTVTLHIGSTEAVLRDVPYGTIFGDLSVQYLTKHNFTKDTDGYYTNDADTYRVTGWSFSSNGSTVVSKNYIITESCEFYAIVAKKITVTFENYYENGEEKTVTRNWYARTDVILPGMTKGVDLFDENSRPGYKFVGWKSENGILYTTAYAMTYHVDHTTTFYAQWEKVTYKVRLLANGSLIGTLEYQIGDSLTLPQTITGQLGYEFLGWSFTNGQTTAGIYTLPTEYEGKLVYRDLTLYACMSPKTYSYSAMINGEFTDIDIVYGTQPTIAVPTQAGHTFTGWYWSDIQLTDGNGKLLQPFTFEWLGQWDDRPKQLTSHWSENSYKVTFKIYIPDVSISSSESTYWETTVVYQNKVTAPQTNPSRTGYDFISWILETDTIYEGNNYKNATAFNFDTPITRDTTLITKFEVQTFNLVFTVGSIKNTVTAEWGKKIYDYGKAYVPTATESRRFIAWIDSNGKTVASTATVTGAMTFTAEYEYSTAFTFVVDATTGEKIEKQYYVGDTATFPEGVAKNGYNFLGWYDSNNKKLSESGVVTATMSTVYYAKYETVTYKITFRTSDNSSTLGTMTYNVEGAVNFADVTFAIPTKTGYTFIGWGDSPYDGQTKTGLPVGSYGDKTFYVQYQADKYQVKLNAGEGTLTETTAEVTYDSTYTLPVPTREGYNFLGWYSAGGSQLTDGNGKSRDPWRMSTSQILTAEYALKDYTVKFVDMDQPSDVLYSKIYKHFEIVEQPDTQYENKTGYTFVEWQNADGTPYVFGATVTGDITVYGKFTINSYTVSVVISPSESYTETLPYGTNLYTLITSKYESLAKTYATDGNRQYLYFSVNGEKVVSGTTLSAFDTTVKAEYKEPVTVTFYDLSSTATPKTVVCYRGDKVPFYTPERNGYTFDGWYLDDYLYTKVPSTDVTVAEGGTYRYYAKWIANSNSLTLVVDGTQYNLTFKTSESETAFDTLTDYPSTAVEKTGWDFLGWYDGENGTGTKYESISAGTAMAGKTLYANLQRHKYTITLNAGDGKVGGQSTATVEWEYGIVEPITFGEVTAPTGKTFAGWYYRDTETGDYFPLFDTKGNPNRAWQEFLRTLTKDITVTAEFV